MARIYQYASSNAKDGFYLLDGYEGKHTTFQVSPDAKELFEHLNFEPGIRNQQKGPRIPDELHWALYEIGWVYTNDSDFTPPTNERGDIIIQGEKLDLSDEVIAQLKEFISSRDDNPRKFDELTSILGIDVGNGEKHEENQEQDTNGHDGISLPPSAKVDEPLTVERIIECMKKVDGVDNQVAGKMLNQLQRDGIIDDDI